MLRLPAATGITARRCRGRPARFGGEKDRREDEGQKRVQRHARCQLLLVYLCRRSAAKRWREQRVRRKLTAKTLEGGQLTGTRCDARTIKIAFCRRRSTHERCRPPMECHRPIQFPQAFQKSRQELVKAARRQAAGTLQLGTPQRHGQPEP